ncbi:hypothetical protein B0H13DRAFT_1932185 [Mycena leptocephala]|nr:hypothetical protein B0H13DRAFT_1932185 [Mycena leptocephala]
MPPAVPKDRFHAFGIHKAPPGLSRRRNVLKLEMLLQNELWDEQVKESGFLPPKPIVVIAMESESADHLLAACPIISISSIPEFNPSQGVQRRRGTEASTAAKNSASRVVISAPFPRTSSRRSTPHPHPRRRAKRLTVGIFWMPHILSPEQYTQKIHPMLDKFTALPSTQKTYQKYDLNLASVIEAHIYTAFSRCEITLTGACSSHRMQKLGSFCWARSRISPSDRRGDQAFNHFNSRLSLSSLFRDSQNFKKLEYISLTRADGSKIKSSHSNSNIPDLVL